MSRKNFKTTIAGLSMIGGAMTMDLWIRERILKTENSTMITSFNKIDTKLDVLQTSLNQNYVSREMLQNLYNHSYELKNSIKIAIDLLNESNSMGDTDKSKILENLNKNNTQASDLTEKLFKILNNNDNINKLSSDDLTIYITSLQEHISQLNSDQLYALVHLFFLISIVMLLLNLASVFYSDSLIKYLNLEIKYPKIKKFLDLRKKFQQFYFGISLLILILIIIILVIFNLLVLFM